VVASSANHANLLMSMEEMKLYRKRRRSPQTTDTKHQNQFRQSSNLWRRDIPTRAYGNFTLPLGDRMASFLNQRLELTNSDLGIMQEVIGRLASDDGLQIIDELTQRARSHPRMASVFSEEIMVFFRS
jgi:hypothetical protein